LLCPDVPGRRWPLPGVCPEYVQKFSSPRRSNDRASLGRRHPAGLPGTKMAAEPLAADLGVRRSAAARRQAPPASPTPRAGTARPGTSKASWPTPLRTSRPPPGTAAACKPGYVWRDARDGDTVCATPGEWDTAHAQNAAAAKYRQPGGGAYGPLTCKSGHVWRDAWDGDGVCVTPRERDVAHRQNQEGPSRAVTSSQQYDLGGLSERARRVATRARGQRHSQIRSCSA
jgi:hypothetical protein